MPLEVMIIHIKIGDAVTLNCDNWRCKPDNRITTIQTFNGNVTQDFGHIESGDTFTCQCNALESNALIILNYWHNQSFVDIVNPAGIIIPNCRVIIIDYGFVENFEAKKVYNFNFEFRRC